MTVLNEAPTPDRQAMEDFLDKDTDPSELDVDTSVDMDNPENDVHKQAIHAINQRNQAMISTITEWVEHLDAFVHKLNGQETDSIQSTLSNAEADTILEKMKNSEQRKIARVATEIAALAESFRGYLAQSNNNSLKYV